MADVTQIRDLEDRLEARLAPKMAAEIQRTMEAMATHWRTHRAMPRTEDHVATVERMYRDFVTEVALEAGELHIGQFKYAMPPELKAEEDEPLFRRIVQEFIEQYGAQKVVQITETTREQIEQVVARGLARGDSLEEISRDMEQRIPVLSRVRSMVIARTETHAASQYSSQRVAETATIELRKRWNSVEDTRTRDFIAAGDEGVNMFDHRVMDGVQVGLKDAFRVPMRNGLFEPLMFPGDPNGSPANVIQCRCVQTYGPADE